MLLPCESDLSESSAYHSTYPIAYGSGTCSTKGRFGHFRHRCKVAPESWVIGGSKVVSSKGLEGYKMFDPRDSRREDREEENT